QHLAALLDHVLLREPSGDLRLNVKALGGEPIWSGELVLLDVVRRDDVVLQRKKAEAHQCTIDVHANRRSVLRSYRPRLFDRRDFEFELWRRSLRIRRDGEQGESSCPHIFTVREYGAVCSRPLE